MKSSGTLLLIAVMAILGASGTSPPYPSPWFLEHIELGLMSLPEGVTVDLAALDPPVPADASFEIHNASPIPLYVIGEHGNADPDYPDIGVTLPAGMGPLNKLADGLAYKWEEQLEGSGWIFAWRREHQRGIVELYSSQENCIVSDVGTAVRLKPVNRYGPGRPASVTVPDPQDAAILLIYGTQELNIPFSISYSLNTDHYFTPSDSCVICLPPDAWACLLIPLLYLAGGGILWFVVRSMKRPARSQSPRQ